MSNTATARIARARISSGDLPDRRKASALRELLGQVMRVELWPGAASGSLDSDAVRAFSYSATVTTLGDGIAHARCVHTPVHYRRSPELMSDGHDDIFLTANRSQGFILRHPKGELTVPAGGLALISKARLHEGITPWGGTSCCIQLPRASLARLLPGLEEAPLRVFQPGEPGAAQATLALAYAGLLADDDCAPSGESAPAGSAAHLRELLASAIDTRWAARLPPQREAEATPRLALIQRDIRARLDQPGLDLATIARLHHTTPRQVQRLFALQGGSFSEFLSAARMERARALLADPAQRHRRVLEIAFDSGFDDISAFSRAFRRRFGMTPTEARQFGGLEI